MAPKEGEDKTERVGVVKALLYQMTSAELKKINSILTHAKSRRTSLEKKWKAAPVGCGMETPEKSVKSLPTPKKPDAKQEHPKQPLPDPEEFRQIVKGLHIYTSRSQPTKIVLSVSEREWWKKFKPSDFVGFDVEFVEMKQPESSLQAHKACICAIYKNDQTYICKRVKWDQSVVKINKHTFKCNGITRQSLRQGEDFETVRSIIAEELKRKIVVTVGGWKDFHSLDLKEDEFLHFDLQSFYNRKDPNNASIDQGLSLRDMYFYHFKYDCQRGQHSCLDDARNTLQIFMKGYTKSVDKFWSTSGAKIITFDDEPNLNSKERKGFLWCDSTKNFIRGCTCSACK